jgi:uridine kinase
MEISQGMKKRQVIVSVAGATSAGKSLIVQIIEDALTAANVNYDFDDEYEWSADEREINKARTTEFVHQIASERVDVTIKERALLRYRGK